MMIISQKKRWFLYSRKRIPACLLKLEVFSLFFYFPLRSKVANNRGKTSPKSKTEQKFKGNI